MKIEMCVSVPNGGFNFIELMSKTINKTISGLHEISLRFTCHDSSQESMIKDSCNGISISGSHIIERIQNNFIHCNSVTHSRCIETMYQATQADVCLICDYDCIPVRKNWDEEIVRQINKENVILLGSPYSELPLNLYGGVPAYKYQRQPNAIFLAINVLKYREVAPSLCRFSHTFDDPACIPLKLISTPLEASQFGLDIGQFLNIDTGSLIPEVIAKNQLKTRLLERKITDYKVISLNSSDLSPFLAPEEYYLDGELFSVHFRKAGSVSTKPNSYGFHQFKADIENYLDKQNI
jgi:hypothetical protein